MGKNQKHKKVLRSEKSKVKLKASSKTKFLPKGTNVTDTNFKIKPIVIREQLKSHSSGELLTKRKLSLKDLLMRLNHHNSTVKLVACEELLELVQGYPQDAVEFNLRPLLERASKLTLEREEKIRSRAIKLISGILQKVPALKVKPFFDILISYTTCAMTHIDIGVQQDSLLIIDTFVKHSPALIVKAFYKMLFNLLTLISKLRSDSNPSRTLTVNLGSNITSLRWRINVLSRLQRILEIFVEENKKSISGYAPSCLIVRVEEIGHSLPLYVGVQRSPIEFFSQSSVTKSEENTAQYSNVVPLLYETWVEVVPLSSSTNGVIISPEAASILSCVIGIFYLLIQLELQSNVKNKVLVQDNQIFFKHILNQFPYRQQDVSYQQKLGNKASQLLENNADPKCVRENLLISCIFCTVYKSLPSAVFQKKAGVILAYIKMCLVKKNYITSENVPILVTTLRIIFFDNSEAWMEQQLRVQEVLDSLVQFHTDPYINSNSKAGVFNLLSDVIQLAHLNKSEKYEQWLTGLPFLLCQWKISSNVIDTLSFLSRQNNSVFLRALLKQMHQILDKVMTIKIDKSGPYPPILKVVNMFSYIPVIPQKDLDMLKIRLTTCSNAKLKHYLKQLLQERET